MFCYMFFWYIAKLVKIFDTTKKKAKKEIPCDIKGKTYVVGPPKSEVPSEKKRNG